MRYGSFPVVVCRGLGFPSNNNVVEMALSATATVCARTVFFMVVVQLFVLSRRAANLRFLCALSMGRRP